MAAEQKPNLNKARQLLADKILASLEQDTIPWRKGWKENPMLHFHNPVSNTKYSGVNLLLLYVSSMQNGWKDTRFITFNQAKQKGWHIKKDSKGVPVEYWSVYDKVNKKNINFSEYNNLVNSSERNKDEFRLVSKTYSVFNGECVEGIPPLEAVQNDRLNDIQMNDFIDRIIKNIGVGFREFGDSAYYSPTNDEITVPPLGSFDNEHEANSTILHEIAHSTGHESRLNRDLSGGFGSETYVIEELRAEMAAVFMSQYVEIDFDAKHLENHKAYIQSWAADIKKDPNVLFRAIKDADQIADYMIENGELEIIQGKEMATEEQEQASSLDDIIKKSEQICNERSQRHLDAKTEVIEEQR